MGIFDGKKKTQAEADLKLTPLQEELAQKLAKASVLEAIDRFVKETAAAEPWLTECQSYYESGRRTVKIHEDLLSVLWTETKVETTANGARVTIIDEDRSAVLHYTDHGFRPLHNHLNAQGNEDVTLDQILFIWGIIVRDHMQAALPQCDFGPVYQSIGEASFSYTVPAKQWADWF